MRFKIDWASLIVGSKFTVFALFYFVFGGNFPSTSPRWAYIWRGDFALPVWVAYIGRGLYMEGSIFGILQYIIITEIRTPTRRFLTVLFEIGILWTYFYSFTTVVRSKTIPDSRPELAKSIPIFRPKRCKNPTLWGGTYLYGLYKGVALGD